MALTAVIEAHGGPEEFKLVDIEVGEPGPNEVRIAHKAVGLNFIDVYQRTGLYPLPMPLNLGMEASGVVEAVGPGVTHLQAGDRAAYASQPPGSYCEVRVMPAKVVCKLPDAIDFDTGAAMMLKGLTAQYLLRRTYRVKKGDWIMVTAAVGGVGSILCQWAKALGAKVIGVVGSDAKVALARREGCKHVLVMGKDDLVARVKEITKGAGVPVVYDSVGKETFFASLDCLAPLGIMVTYGNASGPPPLMSPMELAKRGSLFLTRPSLFAYIAKREDLDAAAKELFRAVTTRKVKLHVGQRYPLSEAAQAHQDLEARKTVGSTVLVP